MSSTVEFFVEAIAKDRTGKSVYVGFVVTGGPIRVGDKFVSMYEIPRTLEDIQLGRRRTFPENVRDISVGVDAIDANRRRVQALPEGVTGALYLAGEDVAFIGARTYLLTSG